MDINIHIECDNAAFDEDGAGPSQEVARILHDLVNKILSGGIGDRSLRDINGNTVGYMEITL